MNPSKVKKKTASDPSEDRAQGRDLHLLIRQIAQGDLSAFAELYQATKSAVFGLILHIVGNDSMAEEVLLDVYMQVWQQASRYDSSRGSVTAWLITIARSRSLDRLRAEKKIRTKEGFDDLRQLPYPEVAPDEASISSERQQIVRAALTTLPAGQRAVIELAYYQGMSQSEIAEKLGCPIGTVKTRVRLAMTKLRELLSVLKH